MTFKWIATRMDDIKKFAMSIIFVVSLVYTGGSFITDHFVTKVEASNYALKSNVAEMDLTLTRMQVVVLQNETFNAKRGGIVAEEKAYYRSIDKRLFLLKIKMGILDATEGDYLVPTWLKE